MRSEPHFITQYSCIRYALTHVRTPVQAWSHLHLANTHMDFSLLQPFYFPVESRNDWMSVDTGFHTYVSAEISHTGREK